MKPSPAKVFPDSEVKMKSYYQFIKRKREESKIARPSY